MSATNRSNVRHVKDYYITPQKDIELFLREFEKDCDIFNRPHIKILDPCAGGDCEHEMSYPAVIKRLYDIEVDTIDIRDDSMAKNKFNYLEFDIDYSPDIIITNPPYYLAIEIIKAALDDVSPVGFVIVLVPVNFFASIKRFDFFKKNMPAYTYVHHKRMSFTDDGKTDANEYCHMVFKKDYSGDITRLRVI